MKKTAIMIAVFILMQSFAMTAFAKTTEKKQLTLHEDGSFTILHLTDTQDDQNPSWDMLNLVRKAIEESKPDLIVMTGDLAEDKKIGDIGIDDESFREGVCVYDSEGEIDHDATLENIKVCADSVLSILEESGVPYILTQGNNDHKCGITNREWLEIYSQYPNCLVTDMSDDADGRIDSYLLIYDRNGNPVYNVWCMDTGRGGVTEEQIAWYKNTANALKEQYGRTIPAVVFQHIHVSDVGNLFVECKITDDGATFNNGKFYRLNPETAHGNNFYAYEPGNTSDEFAAWCEVGDVKGAYFGHQHMDGFTGVTNGIELGFTYGCEMGKIGPYGYRTVILTDTENGMALSGDLYVYSGKVKMDTDTFSKQDDTPVRYSPVVGVFMKFVNVLKALVSVITSNF